MILRHSAIGACAHNARESQGMTPVELKPTTETISLRMPASRLEVIRYEANKRDVPYQSLIKMALADHFKVQPR